MKQICVDCKKEFDDFAPAHGGQRKQRCPACQKIHTKQLQAAARERNKAAKIAKAKAEAAERKSRKETLQKAVSAASTPAPVSEKKGKPHFPAKATAAPMPKSKNNHLSIEEVSRLADAAGMSYGQYVALKLNRIGGTL